MPNTNLLGKEFLADINELIEKNLSDDQFGVSRLAREMGMSRSNLHRKIHSVANVSVSQFLRNKRLQKAQELLRETSLTVSEIAYNVGFSNPSYFSKCFHDLYGYPPGEAGNQNKTKIDSKPSLKKPKQRIAIALTLMASFTVLLVVISFYSKDSFKNFNFLFGKKNKVVAKTIAVLPFIALGEEEGNQIFAEGVTGSILNKLIQINDFKVVAINRPKQVLEGVLNLEEIANEFKTNFLLAGSVQYSEDRVKVLVNLFDAKNKQLIWSDEYNMQLVDIFIIQSDIAKQVA
ncbi:MAG: helix-turn-helix domain-containing protein, partial [Mycoplasmataceae bacterium]|nr:helix-turn-helix domain-containing protein [Mycoplasmataceae bacterium]